MMITAWQADRAVDGASVAPFSDEEASTTVVGPRHSKRAKRCYAFQLPPPSSVADGSQAVDEEDAAAVQAFESALEEQLDADVLKRARMPRDGSASALDGRVLQGWHLISYEELDVRLQDARTLAEVDKIRCTFRLKKKTELLACKKRAEEIWAQYFQENPDGLFNLAYGIAPVDMKLYERFLTPVLTSRDDMRTLGSALDGWARAKLASAFERRDVQKAVKLCAAQLGALGCPDNLSEAVQCLVGCLDSQMEDLQLLRRKQQAEETWTQHFKENPPADMELYARFLSPLLTSRENAHELCSAFDDWAKAKRERGYAESEIRSAMQLCGPHLDVLGSLATLQTTVHDMWRYLDSQIANLRCERLWVRLSGLENVPHQSPAALLSSFLSHFASSLKPLLLSELDMQGVAEVIDQWVGGMIAKGTSEDAVQTAARICAARLLGRRAEPGSHMEPDLAQTLALMRRLLQEHEQLLANVAVTVDSDDD